MDNIFAGLQSWQISVTLSLLKSREIAPSTSGENKPLYGIPTAGMVTSHALMKAKQSPVSKLNLKLGKNKGTCLQTSSESWYSNLSNNYSQQSMIKSPSSLLQWLKLSTSGFLLLLIISWKNIL